MNILIACAVLLFVASCITLISFKLIAASVYIRTVEAYDPPPKPPEKTKIPSPYGIKLASSHSGKNGYCITKNDVPVYTDTATKTYTVYFSRLDVLNEINFLEKMGNYQLTTLGD